MRKKLLAIIPFFVEQLSMTGADDTKRRAPRDLQLGAKNIREMTVCEKGGEGGGKPNLFILGSFPELTRHPPSPHDLAWGLFFSLSLSRI